MEDNSNTTDSDKRSKDIVYIDKSILKRTGVFVAVIWTLLVSAAAGWQLLDGYQNTLESIRLQASGSFEKDLVYRRWVAGHGGVYVRPTEGTPPSPYLSHIKNRDLITQSGIELTLVNPAYMTRQVHELGREQYGLQGHITSLTPLRPENAPDAWEKLVLQTFEQGEVEAFELTTIGDKDFVRLMRPMITEASCLKCHAKQGYKVGDIRGGISISVPMGTQFTLIYRHMAIVITIYIFIWLLGLSGVWFSSVRIWKYIRQRNQSIKELRASEQRFRDLFDNAPLGYQSLDISGDIVEVNETWCKLLGYSKDGILGKNFSQFLHPDDKDIFKMNFPKFKDMGYTRGFEFQMLKKDGSVVSIVFNGRVSRFDDGSFKQTHCVLTDITELKKSQTFSESISKLNESIINSSPLGIAIYNSEGNCVIANTVAAEVTGETKAQMLKQNYHQLDSWKKSGLYDAALWSIKKETKSQHELYFKTIFGKDCILDMRLVPITQGDELHLLIMFDDITEKKISEKELIKQRDLFELVVNSVPARIFWKDSNLVYLGCNIHFAKDSGMDKPGNVIGKDDYDLVWKEDADQYRADDNSVIRTGQPKLNYEEGFLDSEGRKIWWMTNKMPLRSNDGDIIGLIAISENITDKKNAKEQNRKLEAQLQQSQKMESIGNLAGGIAHDFNNILSAVIGFTELALDAVEKETSIECDLQEVYSAGLRAKDLVQQILTFARQSDEKLKPIQVDFIIKEVLKFIRSSTPTTIEFKQNIESDSLIMGNASQIHRIMMNLCTNAAHAMDTNGGTLEVTLKDRIIDTVASRGKWHLKVGNYIEITVSDTGVGVDPQNIDKIFEPYFTTKGLGEGTGMGLAMVHGIVETYGGKIFVESNLGKGTVFTIYLPVATVGRVHLHTQTEELTGGQERILYVDDEDQIVKIGSRMLTQLGYSVTTRTSSVEALELFRLNPNNFDLVISDMTMPQMPGDQLTKKLIDLRPDIPVIICTGYSKRLSEENAIEIGVKAFAYKPIVKADLAKTVRSVLDLA